MNWLRRIILFGLLSSLAILLLRRRIAPATTADDAAAAWPPLTIAPPPTETGTVAGTASTTTSALQPAQRGSTWSPAADGACPDGYPIKVAKSGIYHLPQGRSYGRTHPERCYARAEDAEADGYRRAKL